MVLKIGGILSAVGLVGLLILGGWARRRPCASWARGIENNGPTHG